MARPPEAEIETSMWDFNGSTIVRDMIDRFPVGNRILDVGAGWGKYAMLLAHHDMDAVEIYEPYVEESKLTSLYSDVYVEDICDFEFPNGEYDVIIMGDVLEHIEVEAAQALIERLVTKCQELYVAVPYEWPQDAYGGVVHEIHHQDDLTPEIMETRYPQLKLLAREERKGVYIKR